MVGGLEQGTEQGHPRAAAVEQTLVLVKEVSLPLGPGDTFLWGVTISSFPRRVSAPPIWPARGGNLSDYAWLVMTSEHDGSRGW